MWLPAVPGAEDGLRQGDLLLGVPFARPSGWLLGTQTIRKRGKQTMKPAKCIGILGWIFGHKFTTMDYSYAHCLRCGMPKGGWTTQP